MRTLILAVIVFAFQNHALPVTAPQISDLVGNWTGTSLCQVRPSPCHDEDVVFRFSKPHEDKITVQADKIVDGKAVTMGASEWTYQKSNQTLTWEMPRGIWKVIVNGDTIDGTLVVPDSVVFRKIHLKKSK
ncbi:MAG TPA: hypothetical protein VJT08_19425 [Terriglobales bacterium]|nr:hypothetical protein [Terriglobales bacterium]